MDFLCVFAFVTMSFFAMASARPWRYTAEQATEVIMNHDSDENDYDVASFLLCSVFYCLCGVCIVSVLCIVSFYVYSQSACGINISNTIT